ncbi:MAG: hypothetical protein ABJN36_18425 [Cyclobacteriaceae bacterium]
MRKILVLACLGLFLVLCSSCNDRTLKDLEKASGKVAGEDWEFQGGNAYFGLSDVTIILMNFETSNPCGVLNPSSPYIKFTVPAAIGTYNIPFATPAKSVKFYEGSSSAKNYSSTSGFIQIVSVNDFTVDGLIQASFDDENDVVGAFFVTSCN